MSDYLWDKTGEPDAEVERLEELLGAFAHAPRALELPPDLRVAEPRRRLWPALLAVAAVALLLLCAGLWLAALRGRDAERNIADQPARPAEQPLNSPERRETVTARDTSAATLEQKNFDKQLAERFPRADESTVTSARRVKSPRRQTHASTLAAAPRKAPREDREASARRDERRASDMAVAAFASEQREAKEQLMYALRLTSAKLNEARRRTRDMNGARVESEERNKIR